MKRAACCCYCGMINILLGLNLSCLHKYTPFPLHGVFNGVEAFLYCQIEGAVSDETVTLARQQSTDLFFW